MLHIKGMSIFRYRHVRQAVYRPPYFSLLATTFCLLACWLGSAASIAQPISDSSLVTANQYTDSQYLQTELDKDEPSLVGALSAVKVINQAYLFVPSRVSDFYVDTVGLPQPRAPPQAS